MSVSDSRNSWPDMGRFTVDSPEALIPEDFPDRYDCETVEGAYRCAQAAESEPTEGRKKPRCPQCGSVEVWVKTEQYDAPQKKNTIYKCQAEGCHTHFDNPAYREEGEQ